MEVRTSDGSRSSVESEPISSRRSNGDHARQSPRRRTDQKSEGAEGSLVSHRQFRKHSERESGRESLANQTSPQAPRAREREGARLLTGKPAKALSEGAEGSRVSKRQTHKRSLRSISRHSSEELDRRSNDADSLILCSKIPTVNQERSRSRRRETPRQSRYRSRSRSLKRKNITNSCSDDHHATREGRRRRRRSSSNDSIDSQVHRLLKRRRSRALSRCAVRHTPGSNVPDSTNEILNKFLDILTNVKGQTTHKLSSNNVIPDFDPMSRDQTIITWLTKVEECAEIYGWEEREIIHFALPKLTGVARTWYQGLNTVLFSWTEWKRKLVESFPCRQDYAEILIEMLGKHARYGESLEQYYYAKINLLNRCGIGGRKAVDCLLNGVEDRAVRVGAQAARFREPEDLLKYFKTVKTETARDVGNKPGQDRRLPSQHQSNNREFAEANKTNAPTSFTCHNCNEVGHKSFKCTKPLAKCNSCNRRGHLDLYCRTKPITAQTKDTDKNSGKQIAVLN